MPKLFLKTFITETEAVLAGFQGNYEEEFLKLLTFFFIATGHSGNNPQNKLSQSISVCFFSIVKPEMLQD